MNKQFGIEIPIAVKQKFKQILIDFDKIKYQAKKWTHKAFENNDLKTNTKHSSQNNITFDLFTTTLKIKPDSDTSMERNRLVIDKKLNNLSERLEQISSESKNKDCLTTSDEKHKSRLKSSDKCQIITRLNKNNIEFERIVRPLKESVVASGSSIIKTNRKIEEIIKNNKKSSKIRNNCLALNLAITSWNIYRKKQRPLKRKNSSQQGNYHKKIGIKEIIKNILEFLIKLKKLKLSPTEVILTNQLYRTKYCFY